MLRRDCELASGSLCRKLDLTGAFQPVHADKGLSYGFPTGEKSMIAENEYVVRAQIRAEAGALVEIETGAFEIVIRDLAVIAESVHGYGEDTRFEACYRHAGDSVGVEDALDVWASHVDGAMDHEAGGIDLLLLIANDIATGIDLDQIRGVHLVEAKAIRID